MAKLRATPFVTNAMVTEKDAPSIAHVLWTFDAGAKACETVDTIEWNWLEGETQLRASQVSGYVRRLKKGRYEAHVTAPEKDEAGINAGIASIASAIVEREGGLLMHAAAVEMDAAAVLFIGPSGAGKTTACSHMRGARWLAIDRVAVAEIDLRWWVWRLPWGNKAGLTLDPSPLSHAPLAGILRVRQAERLHIQTCQRFQALMLIRESARSGAATVHREENLLIHGERLSRAHPIGILDFPLGTDLTQAVREWLYEACCDHAR